MNEGRINGRRSDGEEAGGRGRVAGPASAALCPPMGTRVWHHMAWHGMACMTPAGTVQSRGAPASHRRAIELKGWMSEGKMDQSDAEFGSLQYKPDPSVIMVWI